MSTARRILSTPEHRIPRWRLELTFALGFLLTSFLTLMLMAWPDAASTTSNPSSRVHAAILAGLCIIGWWGSFRAARAIVDRDD